MASIDAPVIGIEKRSSLAFVEAMFDAWNEGRVAMACDPATIAAEKRVTIERVRTVAAGGGWFDRRFDFSSDPGLAQISTTSGTTGAPKLIVHDRDAIQDVIRRIADVMEMTGDVKEYLAVPAVYSFGLGRIRAVAAMGGRSYIPANGFRLDELARMLERGEVNSTAMVPTMCRVVIENRQFFQTCGAALRWLEIGSQPMSADEKRAIREIFPNAVIVQHYGLTEASRSTFLRIDTATDAALESVGAPIGDVEIETGDDGRIRIRGPHVACGQLTENGLVSLVDDAGWLTTADLGSIEDGRLTFLGRADDVANVGGVKVSLDRFEEALKGRLEQPNPPIAVARLADKLRGDALIVAHEHDQDAALLKAAALETAAALGLKAADVSYLEMPEIPRTETGKVRRPHISQIAAEKLAEPALHTQTSASAASAEVSELEVRIAAIWREALSVDTVLPTDSFFELGGDSLSAIGAMVAMERAGIPEPLIQKMFEGTSLRELAAGGQPPAASERRMSGLTADAVNATRGILVLIVIMAHWLPFFFDRMGKLRDTAYAVSDPIFRFGTPGFAIMFGLGAAFFQMPLLSRNPGVVRRRLFNNGLIVAGGAVVLAVIILLKNLASQGGLDAQWPTQAFYSVLLFYALAMPLIYPILLFLSRRRHPIVCAVIMVEVSLLLSHLCRDLFGQADTTGLLNVARLMLVARYSLLETGAAALTGIVLGLWILSHETREDLRNTGRLGGIALVLGGLVLIQAVGLDEPSILTLSGHPILAVYAGAVLILISLTFLIFEHAGENRLLDRIVHMLAAIGILSFPFYVGHSLTFESYHLAETLGVPHFAALGGAVGLFLLVAGWAVWKVDRLYFGGRRNMGAAQAGAPLPIV